MSGILGLWNLDGQPVDPALLSKMSRMLAHRGPDGEGSSIQSSIGMACQHLQVTPESVGETQPLIGPAGEMLVFDGRIDNRDELLHSLGIGPAEATKISDAALVQAAFRLYGERLPEQLNGDFAFAIHDPARQMLLLARDAIGVRPLYYYRGKNFFIFASEIKALLAHPSVSTGPNDQALGSLLLSINTAYGGSEGTTFFQDVFSVPTSYEVFVTPDRLKLKQYWDFDPNCQVLSFAMVRQGTEPLHATVVVIDGQAVAFLGDSGYGKSTLAGAFLQAGYQILTDDMLIIKKDDNKYLAHPGPPRIKLFPK